MKITKSSIASWGIIIFTLLTGILFLCITIQSMIAYNHIMENPVTVTATVYKYEEDTKTDADGMDKTEYDLYMSYTYEGEEYTTHYDSVSREAKAQAALGKTVQIQINPDKPDASSNEHSGYFFGFLPGIVCIGLGIMFAYKQIKES